MPLQAKLSVPDTEFAKWGFLFVTVRLTPEELNDDDMLGTRFLKAPLSSSEVNYLGLQVGGRVPGGRGDGA